jgi:hypothetical protein
MKKQSGADPGGAAKQRQRTTSHVRDDPRADRVVVPCDVDLGQPHFGVKDSIRMGNRNARDFTRLPQR